MGGAASLPHLQAEKIKWVMSIPAFKMLTEEKLESVASKVRTLVFWFMRGGGGLPWMLLLGFSGIFLYLCCALCHPLAPQNVKSCQILVPSILHGVKPHNQHAPFPHIPHPSQVKLVQYKTGDVVIEEGTTGTLFGILVSGKLEICARGPNDREIILCQQSPGFFFGEAAIIGNTTTTATIKAKENSAILALTSKELEQVREGMVGKGVGCCRYVVVGCSALRVKSDGWVYEYASILSLLPRRPRYSLLSRTAK